MTSTGSPFLDTGAVAGIISFFIPLVVSLVTKKEASNGVKAAAAAVGSVAAAVLALWWAPDHDPITWQLVVATVLFALITQISAYKAVWQHGVTPAIENATQNFGVGGGGKHVQGEVITDGHDKEIIS
jgi:peptidoglycan/LPS O-acetylase OafA/YrhL